VRPWEGGAHLDPRALEARASRSVGPWNPDHLVGLLVADGIGLVLVFVGWWEASGLGTAHSQLAWLNLSVIGLVAAGGANGWWLARGRRVVTLARAAVLPDPPEVGLSFPAGLAVSNGNAPGRAQPLRRQSTRPAGRSGVSGAGGGLVAGSGMSFYHRASCLLVAGKQVRVAGRAAHEASGLRACEVCRP
jgi:hypothetical protein